MNNKLTGNVQLESLSPSKSKHIIDKIDERLAVHYGLTIEESDYLINYAVKYRVGAADLDE